MNDALRHLDNLLQNSSAGSRPFPPNSRYNGQAVLVHVAADGTQTPYLSRRFVPPSQNFSTLTSHRVVEGDRLDNLAARYFGDPEQFWKICDGNGASRPDELVEAIGRALRITLPQGVG